MGRIKCLYTFQLLTFLDPEGNDAPDIVSLLVPNAGEAEHVARMKTLRNEAEIWSEILNGRDHVKDLDVDERIGCHVKMVHQEIGF
jgi:hypothetical protein